MVKEIDGHGFNYKEVLDNYGLGKGSSYRLIRFRDREKDLERETIDRLRNYPDCDERSFRILNVQDENKLLRILAVPIECPYLGKKKEIEEGHTYIASVQAGVKPLTLLILSDNIDEAENIARVQAARIVDDWNNIEVEVDAVSTERFIAQAKKLIDRGVRLPVSILRFGDLEKYFKNKLEHDRIRKNRG